MRTILSVFILLFLVSCKKVDVPEGTPKCIKQKIREYIRKDDCGGLDDVYRYDFQGGYVYLFRPPNTQCSDISVNVLDENCNLICSLWGIGGISECNGGDVSDMTNRILIWKSQE